MGVGMQIVYFGFAGAARLEAEAGIQLMRLERFAVAHCPDCHVAIESYRREAGQACYDVRLDLIARDGRFVPLPNVTGSEPIEALASAAFDGAEQWLCAGRARLARPDRISPGRIAMKRSIFLTGEHPRVSGGVLDRSIALHRANYRAPAPGTRQAASMRSPLWPL